MNIKQQQKQRKRLITWYKLMFAVCREHDPNPFCFISFTQLVSKRTES